MKLPSFRRLFINDYSAEEQPLVNKLSVTINNGLESLYQALNRQISLSDNIRCTVRDVVVEVDSNGFPVNPTTFTLDFTDLVTSVIVGNATNLTNSAIYPTGAPFISWTQVNSGIRINKITGLPVNNSFRLRIIAFV